MEQLDKQILMEQYTDLCSKLIVAYEAEQEDDILQAIKTVTDKLKNCEVPDGLKDIKQACKNNFYYIYNYGVNTNKQAIEDLEYKTITVLWSGGYDSTALLHSLALKYPNNKIIALSFYVDRISNKKRDMKARQRIKQIFKEQRINNVEFTECALRMSNIANNNGLGQPPMWLMGLTLGMYGCNNAICFAYIREDDIWHYMSAFKQTFEGIKQILQSEHSSLYFPFEWTSKVNILKYLKGANLLDACSTCECLNPNTTEPCGTCLSCVKYNKAIKQLEEMEKQEQEAAKQEPQCVIEDI